VSIQRISQGSTGQASVASISFTPGTHQDGDLLLAVLLSRSDHVFTASNGGWTLAAHVGGTSSQAYPDLKVYTRICNAASDPTSYTFADADSSNAGRPSVAWFVFRGVDATSPFAAGPTTSGPFFNTASPTAPAVTPDIASALVFFVLGAYASNSVFSSETIPSGTTLECNQNTQMPLVIASETGPAANTSTGTGVFATSPATGQGVSLTFALRPSGVFPQPTETISMPAFGKVGTSVTASSSAAESGGSITGYAWSITSAPAGSTAALSGAATSSASFTPDKAGTFTLQCVATDNHGDTVTASASTLARDTTKITVGQVVTRSGTSASSVTLASPTHDTDDMILAIVGWWSQHTEFTPSDSGWAAGPSTDVGQAYGTAFKLYTRTTHLSSYTFAAGSDSGSKPIVALIDLAGVDPSYPFDDFGSIDRVFGLTSVAGPQINPDIAGALILHILGLWPAHYPTPIGATTPSGLAEILNTSGDGSPNGMLAGYLTQSAAGGSTLEAFTCDDTPSPGSPMVVALRRNGIFGPPKVSINASSFIEWRDSFTSTVTATSPGASITTYAWTITAAPSGSTAVLSGASTAAASLTPDKPGSYALQCVVTDSRSQSTTIGSVTVVRPSLYVRQSGAAKAARAWTRVGGVAH
jgi:hypothetical protein